MLNKFKIEGPCYAGGISLSAVVTFVSLVRVCFHTLITERSTPLPLRSLSAPPPADENAGQLGGNRRWGPSWSQPPATRKCSGSKRWRTRSWRTATSSSRSPPPRWTGPTPSSGGACTRPRRAPASTRASNAPERSRLSGRACLAGKWGIRLISWVKKLDLLVALCHEGSNYVFWALLCSSMQDLFVNTIAFFVC